MAPRLVENDMDTLFRELAKLFGRRFTSEHGEYDRSGVWLRELNSSRCNRHGIERGLLRCREQIRQAARQSDTAWPPQAAEFAIMCEPVPADYGMPDAAVAWDEVCQHSSVPERHHWSHPAVRLAGRAVGFWEIERTTAASARAALEKRFKRQYQALVNRVMAGEQLVAQGLLESRDSEPASVTAMRHYDQRAQTAASRFADVGTGKAALDNIRNLVRGVA